VALENLLQLPGVIAAFEFTDRGELVAHELAPGSQIDASVLDMVSHMCVANRCIASMQARGWEQLTGAQGFYPVEGFGLVGFNWSVVCRGQRGLILANENADYEAGFAALGA
jgi:roadblock/LC7 domain-containing protein